MNVVLGGQESAVITHTLGRLSDMMRQTVRMYVLLLLLDWHCDMLVKSCCLLVIAAVHLAYLSFNLSYLSSTVIDVIHCHSCCPLALVVVYLSSSPLGIRPQHPKQWSPWSITGVWADKPDSWPPCHHPGHTQQQAAHQEAPAHRAEHTSHPGAEWSRNGPKVSLGWLEQRATVEGWKWKWYNKVCLCDCNARIEVTGAWSTSVNRSLYVNKLSMHVTEQTGSW